MTITKSRSHELRIRAKSLAAEIAIIKDEERRVIRRAKSLRDHLAMKGQRLDFYAATSAQRSLRQHRIDVVKKHSRCTNIARGFERGLAYSQIERSARLAPDWAEIERLVKRYCPAEAPRWAGWAADAEIYQRGALVKAA